jgi:hypothetical protein
MNFSDVELTIKIKIDDHKILFPQNKLITCIIQELKKNIKKELIEKIELSKLDVNIEPKPISKELVADWVKRSKNRHINIKI